jgi:hypothetical protein
MSCARGVLNRVYNIVGIQGKKGVKNKIWEKSLKNKSTSNHQYRLTSTYILFYVKSICNKMISFQLYLFAATVFNF